MTRKNIEGSPIRPLTKIMQKTPYQIARAFYHDNAVSWDKEVPVYYGKIFSRRGTTRFFKKETWERLENESRTNREAIGLQPFCIWADAHTISVQDEVITITRDANNNTQSFQYGHDTFNTICVKNLEEARKLENNNGLFGGLYVVDYSDKKLYRCTVKIEHKTRLERILNTYVTGLPWFFSHAGVVGKKKLWRGCLDTLQDNPTGNGY
tara:strand:- start:157 stop:783 length:627 start_codon:yes stop_codon:yes gene_type:complete